MKLFITGTDTNVGKTFVTCALARLAVSRNLRTFAFKPIETGCTGEGADQAALCAAAGGWQTGPLRGLYTFPRPAAPWTADPLHTIDLQPILQLAHTPCDVTLIEGAGGWHVPLTPTQDISDLAIGLRFPVVVVARASLGTINHSLLTVRAVESTHLSVAALILSQHPSDDADLAIDNAFRIRSRWPGRTILFTGDPSQLLPLFHVEHDPQSST